jgi:uncharacterized damage-inducible protein DinB
MDVTQMVCQQLEQSFARVRASVSDISDDEARRVMAGKLTPIIWQLGHIATVDGTYVTRAGGTYAPPARYVELFQTGTGGQANYPPLEEVLTFAVTAHDALLAAAREADYGTPAASPRGIFHNVGQMLIFACQHRGYHVGKMTTLRALLGKPILFGPPPGQTRTA